MFFEDDFFSASPIPERRRTGRKMRKRRKGRKRRRRRRRRSVETNGKHYYSLLA